MDLTAPVLAECAGLWRRTLLIEADGTRDTTPGVLWLQGVTAYVDSRGFAGRVMQRDNVFEWQREIDLEAPGEFPDAGAMHWDGDVLVETGVHADYVEHWVRDDAEPLRCGALFLTSEHGAGLLLRVGDSFAFAGGGTVMIGAVDGPQWDGLAIDTAENPIRVADMRWTIDQTEGDVNP